MMAMEETVSPESSLTATLMIHVGEFEKCRDCTETLVENLLSAYVISEFERQQIKQETTPIQRNR